jgi:hypothetical protein
MKLASQSGFVRMQIARLATWIIFVVMPIDCATVLPAAAQSGKRNCNGLAAVAKDDLARLDRAGKAVLFAETPKQCQERFSDFALAIDALEKATGNLVAAKCTIDRQLTQQQDSKSRELLSRRERICDSLGNPPAPEKTPDASSLDPGTRVPAALHQDPTAAPRAEVEIKAEASAPAPPPSLWQRVKNMQTSAPSGLLAAIFLALSALVLLSMALGRMSVSERRARMKVLPEAGAPQPVHVPQVAAAAEAVTFVPIDGGAPYPVQGQRLDGVGITVGRDPKLCDLVVRDQHVSSRHANIWRDAAGLHIRDLGSTNGTWRGGVRVSMATIRTGEAIRIGQTRFYIARRQEGI